MLNPEMIRNTRHNEIDQPVDGLRVLIKAGGQDDDVKKMIGQTCSPHSWQTPVFRDPGFLVSAFGWSWFSCTLHSP